MTLDDDGSRNGVLTKFIDDSASFLLEKLKNQVIHWPSASPPPCPDQPSAFFNFLGNFLDFGSNINVFCQNNLIVELLLQK